MSTQAKEKCPLCLETMDLTDKQLKPCKCGYEICLWCWHHIMEMDQKDECGGRCPGCRSVYNKDRIIGTSIGNQILKDLCADKSNLQQEQMKSQKQRSAKSQLRVAAEPLDPNIVRVIQKKLVYIVGMPSEFASEKVLRQKSFLGQYGKIKNIIIDNIGANQQIPDSGRVYVTFSREEEAILCIEAVNGFILDGRPLKATFGVTRYCHVWLSNKVCQKPNCSYVHQKAPAEDICTKDDVAVVCARLQHLLGMDMKGPQQPSGCTLPSPGDCHSRTTLGNGNSKDKICLNKQLASNDDKSQGNGISDSKQMISAVNVTVDTSWRKPQYANVVSQQSSGPGRRFTVLTRELTSTDTRSKATGQVGCGISNSKKITLPKGEYDDRITIPRCQNVKVVSRRPEEPSHKWTKQLSSAVVKPNAGAEEKSACSDITDNLVQGKHMQLSLSTASASSTALQSLSGSATMLSNLSSSGVMSQISVGSDKLSDSHIKLASESQPQILNQRKAAVSDKGVASTSDSHGIHNNQVVSTDGKHQTSEQVRDHSLYNREMALPGDKISTEHAESILLPRQVSVLSSTDILAKDSKGRKRLACPPGFKELHLSFDSGKDVSVSSSTCSALCSTSDALVQDSLSTADQPDIIRWVSECLEDEGDTTQSNSVSISSTLTSTDTIRRPAQLHGSCFSASNQCLLSPYHGCLLQCMGGVRNPVRSCCTFPSVSSTPNQMPEYWNGSANNYMAPGGYDAFCQNTTSGMKAGMVGTLLQQSSPPGLCTDWTSGSTYPGLNSAQVDLSYPMYTLF